MKITRLNLETKMKENDPEIKEAADKIRTAWVGKESPPEQRSGRTSGSVIRIHPPRPQPDGGVKGGYIWIKGDDGVSYFGHITQLHVGVDILDLRAGQRCTFVATRSSKGPAAELIEMI